MHTCTFQLEVLFSGKMSFSLSNSGRGENSDQININKNKKIFKQGSLVTRGFQWGHTLNKITGITMPKYLNRKI